MLRIQNLHTWYPTSRDLLGRPKSWFKAVQGVSFDIPEGQTIGLVGESGCGKSTLGRSLLRLTPATSGSVTYQGIELLGLTPKEFRPYRKVMQMIFQDPYSSLNPRMDIEHILREPYQWHRPELSASERHQDILRLLDQVGLPANRDTLRRYPHQFSGGQRQRIGIARALAVQPSLIVCDEPVSALDVSVQAQIINLLQDLQRELALSYLFIAHDLAVVEHISDRILVMNQGQIVESGTPQEICHHPQDPYTQKLLASVPLLEA